MQFNNRKKKVTLPIIFLLLIISGYASAQIENPGLKFREPPTSERYTAPTAKCRLYQSIFETLDKKKCVTIIQDVENKSTTWSIVCLPTTGDIYLSFYQKWYTINHLKTLQSRESPLPVKLMRGQ
jgi:hypothetical protein